MPREISFPTSYVTVRKDGAWVKVLPQYKSTKPPGYDDLKPSGEYGRARKAGKRNSSLSVCVGVCEVIQSIIRDSQMVSFNAGSGDPEVHSAHFDVSSLYLVR
jgi:hypothetical protein